MRVFAVPRAGRCANKPSLVAVHGSCRVYDPFEALVAAGAVTSVWANHGVISHTLGGAHQILQLTLGNREIDRSLLPFVFDDPGQVPSWTPAQRRILDSVDTFVIEVSDLRQIRYHDTVFHISVFLRNFVSKYGAPVLEWYRVFSAGESASEELVQKTLAALPGLADDERPIIASILREMRLETMDVDAVKRAIDQIRFNPSARWIFVSHFVVPDLSGSLMQERVKLAAILRQATEACGVEFHDPSATVAEHGRAIALANGGADLYHYSPAFNATMGEWLLRLVLPIGPEISPNAVQDVAATLNTAMVSLHRERVARTDIDQSGLHAHYAQMLDRDEIVDKQKIRIADIILRCLPAFDRYHVLAAGLGELAFLLAAFDCQTVASDPFTARFAAIVAGAERLQASGFVADGALHTTQGRVPDIGRQGRTLAVATHLMLSITAEEEEDVLRRLEAYEGVLFDPAGLVRSRRDVAQREDLLERFRRAGFTLHDLPHQYLVFCSRAG